MAKNDFCMPQGCYLLSHSVGRPLKTSLENATEQSKKPKRGAIERNSQA